MAKDINEALLEIQKAGIPGVVFDSQNPHFKNKYISLGKLIDTIKPVLNNAGILFYQSPSNIGGTPALETTLYHEETATAVTGVCPLILQKSDPQGVGSAITYMRRYALLSMLGLVADEDDDAESASSDVGTASGGEPEREVVNSEGVFSNTSDPEKKPLF